MRRFSALETSGSNYRIRDKDRPDGLVNTENFCKMRRRFSDTAFEYVKLKSSESLVIQKKTYETVPRLEVEQIDLGELLGSGGFCDVRKVHRLSNSSSISTDSKMKNSDIPKEDKSKFAALIRSKKPKNLFEDNETGYVIKYIRSKVREDPDLYQSAVEDLALEVEYLGNLNHPNIIEIHGMSASGFSGFDQNKDAGYFVMLEELTESLQQRSKKWLSIERKKFKLQK